MVAFFSPAVSASMMRPRMTTGNPLRKRGNSFRRMNAKPPRSSALFQSHDDIDAAVVHRGHSGDSIAAAEIEVTVSKVS